MAGSMLYMIWAVYGLMLLDFLIGIGQFFWEGSFSAIPKLVVDLLKDVLYYVFPLMVLVSSMALDPTGWILMIVYYLGGLAVVWNYMIAIKNRF